MTGTRRRPESTAMTKEKQASLGVAAGRCDHCDQPRSKGRPRFCCVVCGEGFWADVRDAGLPIVVAANQARFAEVRALAPEPEPLPEPEPEPKAKVYTRKCPGCGKMFDTETPQKRHCSEPCRLDKNRRAYIDRKVAAQAPAQPAGQDQSFEVIFKALEARMAKYERMTNRAELKAVLKELQLEEIDKPRPARDVTPNGLDKHP